MEICDKNIDEGKFHALCAQLPICLVGYAWPKVSDPSVEDLLYMIDE